MPVTPIPQSRLLLTDQYSFLLEVDNDRMTLFPATGQEPLFQLNEPVLLAQGIIDDTNQIHLAYIKNTGELCYDLISINGEHQSMPLGKLDVRTQRFEQLLLFPMGKVIHIFYASSYYSLPDVWRITHLFWNGQTWRSAMIGEVVHPRRPLFHVLIDSRSNLHVLMMTFLGNRSVLMSSIFNGSFFVWSKRQEVLNIPREVIDMTATITADDRGYLFWAAKQPGSDRFEIGQATHAKINDFRSSWQVEAPPATDLQGPWRGLGVLQSQGVLSLMIYLKQAVLFQLQDYSWKPLQTLSATFLPLVIAQKSQGIINYTHWLREENQENAIFADWLKLPKAVSEDTPASAQKPFPLADDSPSTGENAPQDNSALPVEDSLVGDSFDNPTKVLPEETPSAEDLGLIFNNLKTTTLNLTNNLESLSEKVDSLPIALQILKELKAKNEETLAALQQLEAKVNALQDQQQITSKKGFWQRWLM